MSMIRTYLPWFVAFLYFVSPYDILPDFLTGPGWLDDLGVLALAWWWTSRLKRADQTRSGPGAWEKKRQAPPGDDWRAKEDPFKDEEPYKILGIEKDATEAEIKTAYRRLIAQYHPDKVQHLGKEFQELAHKKFVAIQRAYDTLMG